MKGITVLFASVVLCLFTVVAGHQSYQRQIPHGAIVQHPCQRGRSWPTVGHKIPIRPSGPGPQLNLFGLDWQASGTDWKAICRLDSDGDGLTNGEELGDPYCEWEFDGTPRFRPRGHPGFCDEGRQQCSTDDRALLTGSDGCDDRIIRGFRRVPPGRRPGRTRGQQPQLPPAIGNDHPQTHLTKLGRISGMGGQPRFGGPTSFTMPGAQVPGISSVPGMSGFPGISSTLGRSGVPGMPGIPGMSGVPGMASVPGMAGIPGISRVSGMSPAPGMSGDPRMPGVPGISGFPGMSGAPQTFRGLDRMVGMSVFGSRPGQSAMFPIGAGTFFPGSASSMSSPSFIGARSPGMMGQVPSFLRPPITGGGASPAVAMGTADGRMPTLEGVGGVVPRTPGMRMRFPTHVSRHFGSSPIGMRMPGTEGRVSGTSGSARSVLGTYRGRM